MGAGGALVGGFGGVQLTNKKGVTIRLQDAVPEAAALSSLGQTSIYKAIKEGRLRIRKYGTRTIITRTDLGVLLGKSAR